MCSSVFAALIQVYTDSRSLSRKNSRASGFQTPFSARSQRRLDPYSASLEDKAVHEASYNHNYLCIRVF
jgi:hypothetical protein